MANGTKIPKPVWGLLAVIHLVVMTLTWRDISRRRVDQVRGSKWLWRVATGLNTGGATVAYLLVGRRRKAKGRA